MLEISVSLIEVLEMKNNKPIPYRCAFLGTLLISLDLILILSSSATMPASPCCGYGSRVVFNDGDEGRPLNSLCPNPYFRFRDIGLDNGFYDEFDPVYLDMDADKRVSTDDIRITPFVEFFPGSKVTRTDMDINSSFITLINWSISFIDLNGDGSYSLQDPVYLHNKSRGDQIVPGDIRLNLFNGLPGTRVAGSSPDANSFALDLLGLTRYINNTETVAIRFFNSNGNYLNETPQYDRLDAVYLHILASKKELESGTIGFVSPNDLRLSL
jgi:hypothetical protein